MTTIPIHRRGSDRPVAHEGAVSADDAPASLGNSPGLRAGGFLPVIDLTAHRDALSDRYKRLKAERKHKAAEVVRVRLQAVTQVMLGGVRHG